MALLEPSQIPLREGELFARRFRVTRLLGVGGMGAVARATHEGLEQPVAIKVLLASALRAPDARERFLREARAAASLKSPHVVRVTDVDVDESGLPYMVMEYLEGRDLQHLLDTSGPLPLPLAISYVTQACEAIAEAHDIGIVHRDLKPANLFLAKSGQSEILKILDFGISKPMGAESLTKDGFLGSPLYASPEQIERPREVSFATDIWSLGVIFFVLLTGKSAFESETLPELIRKICTTRVPRAADFVPSLPSAVDDIIACACAKDPRARFATVRDLRDALSGLVVRSSKPIALSAPSFAPAAFARTVSSAPPPAYAPKGHVSLPASAGQAAADRVEGLHGGVGRTAQSPGVPIANGPLVRPSSAPQIAAAPGAYQRLSPPISSTPPLADTKGAMSATFPGSVRTRKSLLLWVGIAAAFLGLIQFRPTVHFERTNTPASVTPAIAPTFAPELVPGPAASTLGVATIPGTATPATSLDGNGGGSSSSLPPPRASATKPPPHATTVRSSKAGHAKPPSTSME